MPTVRTAPTWLVQVHVDAAQPARSEHGGGSLGSPHDSPAVPWPDGGALRRFRTRRRLGGRPAAGTRRSDRRRGRAGHRDRPAGADPARGVRGRRRDTAGRRARKRACACCPRRPGSWPGRRRYERRSRQRGDPGEGRAGGGRRDPAPLARSQRPRRRARVLLAERGARRAPVVSCTRPPARHARSTRCVPPRRRHTVRAWVRAR